MPRKTTQTAIILFVLAFLDHQLHPFTLVQSAKRMKRVAVIGSGNWGTASARRIALNLLDQNQSYFVRANNDDSDLLSTNSHPNSNECEYDSEVKMWVYEEIVNGRNLTSIINEDHENVKYLPGVKLPATVVACSDVIATCADADMLFFVIPHQFLRGVLAQMKGHVKPSAIGVSLIKGLDVGPDGPILLSEMIEQELCLSHPIAVAMGANVASEVAQDEFVEITVACRDKQVARTVCELLDSPCFRTAICTDVVTVELCGALKNVVAMGAGFCDAMGLGSSTKAAIIRRGIAETMDFCKMIAGPSYEPETVMQSCGLADMIATSYGGRNRLCSAAFAERLLKMEEAEQAVASTRNSLAQPFDPLSASGEEKHEGQVVLGDSRESGDEEGVTGPAVGARARGEVSRGDERQTFLSKLWRDLETDLLHGQKLQGLQTCAELFGCLIAKGLDRELMADKEDRPCQTYAHFMHMRQEQLTRESEEMARLLAVEGPSLAQQQQYQLQHPHPPVKLPGAMSELKKQGQVSGMTLDGPSRHDSLASTGRSVSPFSTDTTAGGCGSEERRLKRAVTKVHEKRFGLFLRIHAIAYRGESPRTLFDW